MKKPVILLIVLTLVKFASGQDLPRSASFGVMVKDLDDSTRTALKLLSTKGTLIMQVFDGTSADAAGFAVNDVMVNMGGESIERTRDFLNMLNKYKSGDRVKVTYYRQAQRNMKVFTLQPKPLETSSAYEVIYSSVRSGENHLRTLITKPKTKGTFPAVLIIGGVGCYSIDNPAGKNLRSIKMWVDSLTAYGMVTMRVEKTGMGDSQGIPCEACDYFTEEQGYLDGLKQLKSMPYVDTDKVFLAGFSMGGVIAPRIARKERVEGMIVYGTVGRNWLEYELENSHRQRLLEDYPADSMDFWMRAEYKRLYGLFVDRETPEQIMQEHPETTPNFFRYPMRVEYFQQVAGLDIRSLWMHTDAHVLAMHGTSDFVSSAGEHALIAGIVNRYHPGKATYAEIVHSDHWELLTESERESKAHTSDEINPAALEMAIRWLNNHLGGHSGKDQ